MPESILHGDLLCFWLFASCYVPDIFVLVVCVSFAAAHTCSRDSHEMHLNTPLLCSVDLTAGPIPNRCSSPRSEFTLSVIRQVQILTLAHAVDSDLCLC